MRERNGDFEDNGDIGDLSHLALTSPSSPWSPKSPFSRRQHFHIGNIQPRLAPPQNELRPVAPCPKTFSHSFPPPGRRFDILVSAMLKQSFRDFIFSTNTDGSGKAASYVRALDMLGPVLTRHYPHPHHQRHDVVAVFACRHTGHPQVDLQRAGRDRRGVGEIHF